MVKEVHNTGTHEFDNIDSEGLYTDSRGVDVVIRKDSDGDYVADGGDSELGRDSDAANLLENVVSVEGSSHIHFTEGVFEFNSQAFINTQGVVVSGSGRGVTEFKAVDSNAHIRVENVSDIKFSGFTFNGNDTTTLGIDYFLDAVETAENILVENIEFRDVTNLTTGSSEYVLRFFGNGQDDLKDVTVRNCNFLDNSVNAEVLEASVVQDLTLKNLFFANNTDPEIYLLKCSDTIIENIHLDGDRIAIDGGFDVHIKNVYAQNNEAVVLEPAPGIDSRVNEQITIEGGRVKVFAIQKNYNVTIKNVVCTGFDQGGRVFRIDGNSNNEDFLLKNNIFDENGVNGNSMIAIDCQIDDAVIEGNYFVDRRSTKYQQALTLSASPRVINNSILGSNKIAIQAQSQSIDLEVLGNKVFDSNAEGILVRDYDESVIRDNYVKNAGGKGISLDDDVGGRVNYNVVENNKVLNSALDGITTQGGNNNIIKDNDVRNNNPNIDANGADDVVKSNRGYVTEDRGSATQSGDGTTTVFSISHNLDELPSYVSVEASSEDASTDFYVSDKTSSSIEITYANAPNDGTDNLSWEWEAEV